MKRLVTLIAAARQSQRGEAIEDGAFGGQFSADEG